MIAVCLLAAVLATAPNPAHEGRALEGQKLSQWEEMDAAAQRITLLVAGAMVLVLTGLLWRQLRRRSAPPQDPARLHRWFRGDHFDWVTGTATSISHTTHEEQRFTPEGQAVGNSRPKPIFITIIREECTLLFDGGQHDLLVSFADDRHGGRAFPVFRGREGHRITAVWRRRPKAEERGHYVLFRDWTAGRNLDHPAAAPHIHQSDAPIFSFAPILILGWILGVSTEWLPFVGGIPRDLIFAVAFGVVWFAFQFVIGTIDRGRSHEQLAQALLVIGTGDAAPQDANAAP